MDRNNYRLKEAMSLEPRVYQWELAQFLHMGETTLVKRLRTELDPETMDEYLRAIDQLRKTK